MTRAAYRVHQMIQDLMADPHAAAGFARDAEPAFQRYGLTDQERRLLRDGSPEALIGLGVHPNLQMKYARLRSQASPASGGPLDAYLDRLTRRS